jgi:hypothetical protein
VTQDVFSQYNAWLQAGRLGLGSLQNFDFFFFGGRNQPMSPTSQT